jgi:hypothetical protein
VHRHRTVDALPPNDVSREGFVPDSRLVERKIKMRVRRVLRRKGNAEFACGFSARDGALQALLEHESRDDGRG